MKEQHIEDVSWSGGFLTDVTKLPPSDQSKGGLGQKRPLDTSTGICNSNTHTGKGELRLSTVKSSRSSLHHSGQLQTGSSRCNRVCDKNQRFGTFSLRTKTRARLFGACWAYTSFWPYSCLATGRDPYRSATICNWLVGSYTDGQTRMSDPAIIWCARLSSHFKSTRALSVCKE